MSDFVIMTDSTADLPNEVIEKYEISVVPMEFILNEKLYHHYPDAREMDLHEFYERITAGESVSTSQINYTLYEDAMKPILKEGKDILYICFTSGLSGTYQSARLAVSDLQEKYPDRKIIVIDSLCAAIGEGYLVYRAALEKENGMDIDELAAWIMDHRLKIRHWFVVDNLEQLRKGGRISSATAMIGAALNVKPLLSVDKKGKLVNVGKLRGTKKINATFGSKIEADGFETTKYPVLIGHADAKESAEGLAAYLKEQGLIEEAMIADIGPIIGAHVGRGMFALVYMSDKDLED